MRPARPHRAHSPCALPLLAALILALPACDEDPDPIDVAISLDETDADQDGFSADDCDDSDPDAHPGAPERLNGADDDCDARVDEGTDAYDDDGDGYSEQDGDADDASPAVYPGAPELADGLDNDQDGQIDEGTAAYDDDGDGYSEADGDADDADASTYPGAPELADGLDNDQDGAVDEGATDPGADRDGDGHDAARQGGDDCDDTDAAVHPGASEAVNGADDDCDERVDEGTRAYDDDGDGYSEDQGDCNDKRNVVYPGASELVGGLPDGVDNDCDGAVDEGTAAVDADGDSYPDGDDCDDSDADIFPGASETANDLDDDCDGAVDEATRFYDDDGDGLSEEEGDCDDTRADVSPLNAEVCNGFDDDCTGVIDEPCVTCAVPGDFDGLEAAAAAGCSDVLVATGASVPVRIVDPPGSITIRSEGATATSLEISLSPAELSRDVSVVGFTLAAAGTIDNQDPQATVELALITARDLITEAGALLITGHNVGVADSVFEGCQATAGAEAAGALNLTDAKSFTVRRSIFRANRALGAIYSAAGGIYIGGARSSGTIEATLFNANLANGAENGSAIFIDSPVEQPLYLLNDTFVDNEAEGGGVAALRCGGPLPGGIIDSTIMWHQHGDHISGCEGVAISWSNFDGGAAEGTGNVSVDPKFKSDGTFSPKPSSPVVDAGNPEASRSDRDGSRNDQGYTGGPFGQ